LVGKWTTARSSVRHCKVSFIGAATHGHPRVESNSIAEIGREKKEKIRLADRSRD
jgi:hypothetical protein